MGFVRIDNYNGEQGYIPGDTLPLDMVVKGGVKYLLPPQRLQRHTRDAPRPVAYRIVREHKDTATAVTVTDIKLLDNLEELLLSNAADTAVDMDDE